MTNAITGGSFEHFKYVTNNFSMTGEKVIGKMSVALVWCFSNFAMLLLNHCCNIWIFIDAFA